MRTSLLILIVGVFVGCSADPKRTTNVSNVSSDQSPAPSPVLNASPLSVQPAVVDQKIVDEVKRIVAKVMGVDAKAIDANVPLTKQKVAANELDVVEIIMEIEERFKIEIKDDEVGGGDLSQVANITVNQLADIVGRKQKANNTAPK